MAVQDLRSVYLWIVDDVMTKIKPEFVQEGFDEAVLLAVRRRWEERMRTKGLLSPPEGPASLHPHRGDDASGSHMGGHKRPYDHAGPSQPLVKLEPRPLGMGVPMGQHGPMLSGAPPGLPNMPRLMAMPQASLAQQHQQQQGAAGMQRLVAPGGMGQPPLVMHMVTPHQYAAVVAAQQQAQAQQQQRAAAAAALAATAAAAAAAAAAPSQPAPHGGLGPPPGTIPQTDGPADGDDADGDEGGGAAGGGGVDDDEPPLEPVGPDDTRLDDADDEALQEEEKACNNTIYCLYDKVHRSKSRWKCTLRHGVVTMEGRDYLFHKAMCEMEFK